MSAVHHTGRAWVVVDDPWWAARELSAAEAVRYEWGEACWTARLLAQGEVADRELRAVLARPPL